MHPRPANPTLRRFAVAFIAFIALAALVSPTIKRHELDLGSGRTRTTTTKWWFIRSVEQQDNALSLAVQQPGPERWVVTTRNATGVFGGPSCSYGIGMQPSQRAREVAEAFELLSIPPADRRVIGAAVIPLLSGDSQWAVELGEADLEIISEGRLIIAWPTR